MILFTIAILSAIVVAMYKFEIDIDDNNRVLKIAIFIAALACLVVASSVDDAEGCVTDADCAIGSECLQIDGLGGACVGGIWPGNDNDAYPSSPYDRPYGDTCSFDVDCAPGYRCFKSDGEIEGACVK